MWTVFSHPTTGMLFESRELWNDPATAFRTRPLEWRPLSDELRAAKAGACTVGEEVSWLRPGEWIASDGLVVEVGG